MSSIRVNASIRMGPIVRLGLVVGLSAGLVVSLTGCDRARPVQIALSPDDGSVRAVVCEDIEVTSLRVSIPGGWINTEKTLWDLTGSGSFTLGEEFVLLDDPPSGLRIDGDPGSQSEIASSDFVYVVLIGDPSGASQYDLTKADAGKWLRQDGSVSDEPCP